MRKNAPAVHHFKFLFQLTISIVFGGLSAPLVTPPKVDSRVAKLQLLQQLQKQLQNLVQLRDLRRKMQSSAVPIVGYLSGQRHVILCIYIYYHINIYVMNIYGIRMCTLCMSCAYLKHMWSKLPTKCSRLH